MKKAWLILLIFCQIVVAQSTANSVVEASPKESDDIFSTSLGGLRGKLLTRSDNEFVKNGEGSTIKLKDGVYYHVFTRHQRGAEGSNPDLWDAVIAGMYSRDNGQTWSQPTTIFRSTTGKNAMSPALARLKNGNLGIAYSRIDSVSAGTKVFRYSSDEGHTWSNEILITPADGYWTSAHDRLLVLSSGRVLLPLHTKLVAKPLKIATRVAYSDDDGKSWKISPQTLLVKDVIPEYISKYSAYYEAVFAEASIAENADGSLLMLGRTIAGFIYASTSHDKGITWTQPLPTSLMSSATSFRLIKVPRSSDLLVIWNSCCLDPAYLLLGQRLTISSAVSTDSGKTWNWQREVASVAPGNGNGIDYPSLYIDNDKVFITYRAYSNALNKLPTEINQYLAILPLNWFYAGRDFHRPETLKTTNAETGKN